MIATCPGKTAGNKLLTDRQFEAMAALFIGWEMPILIAGSHRKVFWGFGLARGFGGTRPGQPKTSKFGFVSGPGRDTRIALRANRCQARLKCGLWPGSMGIIVAFIMKIQIQWNVAKCSHYTTMNQIQSMYIWGPGRVHGFCGSFHFLLVRSEALDDAEEILLEEPSHPKARYRPSIAQQSNQSAP